jgi:hypothetical protein
MNHCCAYCSNKFIASRSDARYCSNSCRTRAYVLRKKGGNIDGSGRPPGISIKNVFYNFGLIVFLRSLFQLFSRK